MKSILLFIVLFFFAYRYCQSQDSTMVLSASMFDESTLGLPMGNREGWVFKQGHDPEWAKTDLSTDDWKPLKPAHFTAAYADHTGKAEGWFRIKMKVDTAFHNPSLGLKVGVWAATDVYLNGKLLVPFGNTGTNGAPFQEYSPFGRLTFPVKLEAGKEYLIAMHVVDYLAPVPPRRLKSAYNLTNSLILTAPGYDTLFLKRSKTISFYSGIWIAVTLMLSLFFWLLYRLNPQERTIGLIAIGATLLAAHHLLINSNMPPDVSFARFATHNHVNTLVLAAIVGWIPMILARIFKQHISGTVKGIVLACSLGIVVSDFFPGPLLFLLCLCLVFIICIYYIISSWKLLKGAQWAIVGGFLLTFFSGTLYAFTLMDTSVNLSFYLLLTTAYSLSAPLGMLVYVSLRFKEVLKEVKVHAEKIVSLSEEKRQQAIHQQKILQEEVNRQTADLTTTLHHLKATQAQLIQSEKMASLGELTAGIAHEIQNPLNFVNNFSEVSAELIEELQQELNSGEITEAKSIADDIKQNLEKIHHHGRRADSIVKGMLQHSRSSSGERQLTDLNALTDEYLRLAYHGLRAKEKDFNADFKLEADPHIGKIEVVPQEIGRVLLNLFNNAFYATGQKKAKLNGQYQPQVTVTTKVVGNKVEIHVKDNGTGIPEGVQQKIFQPFFTTKPTGEGTGLGLSLSYDIITKGHGGEIRVESKEGEGSEFVVYLPTKKIYTRIGMKTFCFILQFIFLSYSCWSQDTREIIHIKSLPAEGFLLDKGWKFQAGDNPEYANLDYDDSNWQRINPTLDMRDLSESTRSGICWLRLHLVVDSSLLQEQLSLIIAQSVASEIYLNGRLLYKFGTVSDNPEKIMAYNPLAMPFSLPFDKSKEQLLAVRYVFQPNISYPAAFGQSPFLRIHINKTYAAVKQWRRLDRGLPTSIIIRIGAFIILAIFYLSFFVYYPEQKANLFFFLHALLLMVGDVIQFNFVSGDIEVQYLFLLVNLAVAFWDLAHLFLLTALYSLLRQKRSGIYLGLTAAIFVGIFLNFSGSPNGFVISQFVISNLVNIEIVRTAVKALKLNMKGAWIIAAGAISFSIFWAAFVLGTSIYNYIYIPISENYQLGDVLYNLAYLSIPMATAIYMALDFAFTSHALKEKLTQVEDLSRKTLAQEKEKQQILSSQKETLEKQVTERTTELKQSLDELKATQSQLIQAEKMASLGELTAGIAHEIQNPLNFVNNFSEVSQELCGEIEQETKEGNTQEVLSITADLKQNLEKIYHHGKRADSIVKGMLEHSRASSGEKQPTDIHKLVDEYLHLAYHGLRAKDKEFNAQFTFTPDTSVPHLKVAPQEIGRVLLNLFNNAFYATAQKKAQLNRQYQPQVTVTTQAIGNKIEIRVKDNGTGIPDSIKSKIFQPFFTTKPTGEGTGLGLSLSYDIITKGHGGEIRVESKEDEGSEFIIQLFTTR